jgi:hypothetical protein
MESKLAPCIRRIVVVGTTGSGKTSFAARLAHLCQIPHIEIDAMYWRPKWTHASEEELRGLIDRATSAPAWIVDGNYGICRDIVWGRAQALVWLDYPLWTTFWRLFFRTMKRSLSQELLWGNNYENLWSQLKLWSNDSLFTWLFKTHGRHKRQFPPLFVSPQFSHLQIYHFKSPPQAEAWLQSIGETSR